MMELDEKVRFLADPASYPNEMGKVETRETHMSWVFIAEAGVLKLKKPVKRTFLDFSTLEARKFFCSGLRFGPASQITIPAGGLWKRCNERPDRRPHSITRTKGQKLLAKRAAYRLKRGVA